MLFHIVFRYCSNTQQILDLENLILPAGRLAAVSDGDLFKLAD